MQQIINSTASSRQSGTPRVLEWESVQQISKALNCYSSGIVSRIWYRQTAATGEPKALAASVNGVVDHIADQV
jgi:hypothetical protein